ncbi:MAG: sigma-70 family RNA polymerase sigma factor [Oscillospiraceae bacterium]|nr:sigma-70 family RNA polymerase sigma factor [Oscillospiraceae bacterium]
MIEQKISKEQVYLAYKDKVAAYLRNRTRSPEDAEDLCNDIFMKVFQKLDSFNESRAKLSTWIFAITRNAVIDYYRTGHISEELSGEEVDDSEGVEETVLSREMLARLAEELKKLPEQQRDIIVLRYYKGLTLQKISEKMGLSYGAVKLRHSAALKALREGLS